jgi:hypothetical protein
MKNGICQLDSLKTFHLQHSIGGRSRALILGLVAKRVRGMVRPGKGSNAD